MQHVRQLRSPRKVSVPVAPDLTYAWEPLKGALKEYALLLGHMIREVGHNHDVSPLDPNWDQYLGMETLGIMRFLAVRDGGKLVGCAMCMVGPNMDFSSTKWATVLRFYLLPEYRRGTRAMKMLRLLHDQLRSEGVRIVTAAERLVHQTVRGRTSKSLWEYGGYNPLETIHVKVLEA